MMHRSDTGDRHLVVGAGPIGAGVALALARRGHPVTVASRSGSGPTAEGIERVAADASDPDAMLRLAAGATAIYDCTNPAYHRWPIDWPPIARSLRAATERSRAVLVMVSNLYGYGPPSAALGVPAYDDRHPMTEATPQAASGHKGRVRSQMWADALALHEAGRIRAVEVRSSDYVGPGVQSVLGERAIGPLLRGRPIQVLGNVDRLHTWTFVDDVVSMVVTAATDPRAWGRAWHTPSNPPRSISGVLDDLARRAGAPPPRVRTLPSIGLRALGLVSPFLCELRETEYQFRADFVMDSSAAQRTFELAPTPWDSVLDAILAAARPQEAGAPVADVLAVTGR
jgi:nucleoside-diphosphate-sugar epimerase